MLLALLLSCGNDTVVLQGNSIGSCSYESPFSGEQECRDFYATDTDQASANCEDLDATFKEGIACEPKEILGYCIFEQDGIQIRAAVEDTDSGKCGSNRFGCETFAKGVWQPAALCDGTDELVVLSDPFPQPVQVCVDPLPGEPEGQSEGGKVCTWEIVSGVTEEGRNFSDYADCATVVRQRGYTPVPANELASTEDPRMQDPAYVEDLDWVRGQLRAGSCACCHSAVAPDGASVFDADFEGNMANQFNDRGLAMGAGWIPTVGFGTYPPEQNNGFERSSPENPYLSIIPTTDQQRMMAFFEGELAYRGLTKADFEGDTYGAGPLDVQRLYEPEQCSDQEGIAADGTIRWLPGRARYIYVMKADATSPTVPPNLDLPEGTLWRVDLPEDGEPVYSASVVYGKVPEGMNQVFPTSGVPEPLVQGEKYYLYVSADVLYPISRCIFTAGEEPKGCNTAGGSVGFWGMGALATLALRRRK